MLQHPAGGPAGIAPGFLEHAGRAGADEKRGERARWGGKGGNSIASEMAGVPEMWPLGRERKKKGQLGKKKKEKRRMWDLGFVKIAKEAMLN